jgi:prophage regulatory protein
MSEIKSRYTRPKEVCHRFNFSQPTLWRWVKLGKFPKPHKLSPAITGFLDKDLDEWEKDPMKYWAKS